MKIGIDKLSFFAPPTYIDMVDLANARDVDPNKYLIGIGQEKMAIAPNTYDVVSLAANAANKILTDEDKAAIDMVLFATETGVDHSKSGAAWVHEVLGIQPYARAVEMKQACYSGTAAIQFALGHIALNPKSKVLVLASDIAKYGLNTGGEPTQGAGAVAMLITAEPNILAIERESMSYTKEIDDFWRPNYSEVPYVDGKYSNQAYLDSLLATWNGYKDKYHADLNDIEAMIMHVPYTKMGRKGLEALSDQMNEMTADRLDDHYEKAIIYNKAVGNIYTGSLYLSLVSLLEQTEELPVDARIGMFSYGSGSVGEFFVGQIQAGYQDHILTEYHERLLNDRQELTIDAYETLLSEEVVLDDTGNVKVESEYTVADDFVFTGIENHSRQYQ